MKISKLKIAAAGCCGFTAVELMIVLAIMGIMLVAAAPSFVQFTRNSRIKSGAQIVVSALRTARSYAIKRRKRCAVLFNTNDIDNAGYAVKIYWDPATYPEGGSVTAWKMLPKTIIMVTHGSLSSCDDIPFPNDTDTSNLKDNIKSIIFKPMGGTVSVSMDEAVQVSDETRIDTSYIGITQITGRIKTSRTP